MNRTRAILAATFAHGLAAFAVASHAEEAKKPMEKCHGLALASKNDGAACAVMSCAGTFA